MQAVTYFAEFSTNHPRDTSNYYLSSVFAQIVPERTQLDLSATFSPLQHYFRDHCKKFRDEIETATSEILFTFCVRFFEHRFSASSLRFGLKRARITRGRRFKFEADSAEKTVVSPLSCEKTEEPEEFRQSCPSVREAEILSTFERKFVWSGG